MMRFRKASEVPEAFTPEAYTEYLTSAIWRRIRQAAMERDWYCCRRCGDDATEVHHLWYPRKWGWEELDSLISLCSAHHRAIHEPCPTEE
jgi:5-methylcytosine-specific restriction endonuclease McrA